MGKKLGPNDSFSRGDGVTEIYVIQRDGTKHTILVDTQDYLDYDLESYRWCVWKNKRAYTFYVVAWKRVEENKKRVTLHCLLLDPPTGYEPDHIDRNGLNNCRSNLRIVTRSQNSSNRRLRSDNTSGYKGVRKDGSKWRAELGRTLAIGKKSCSIGYYDTAIAAAEARDKAVLRKFQEFAWLNFPEKRAQYEAELNKEIV